MSKKLSRAERKELRQKALKSPVRALRPQAQKQGTSTKETAVEAAKPQAASAATSKGDERPRGSQPARSVSKSAAGSVSAPAGSDKKTRKPHIAAVLGALVIGAGLVSYLGPKLGEWSKRPKDEIKAESQQPPPAPTKQEAPPPAPVEHAGDALSSGTAAPANEAPSAAPAGSEAAPSTSVAASASSPPASPSSAPSASTAPSASAAPKTPKKPKPGAPKIVTEDPYN